MLEGVGGGQEVEQVEGLERTAVEVNRVGDNGGAGLLEEVLGPGHVEGGGDQQDGGVGGQQGGYGLGFGGGVVDLAGDGDGAGGDALGLGDRLELLAFGGSIRLPGHPAAGEDQAGGFAGAVEVEAAPEAIAALVPFADGGGVGAGDGFQHAAEHNDGVSGGQGGGVKAVAVLFNGGDQAIAE